MDDRTAQHAQTLVDWSARIESGDDVVLSVGEGAHDLGVAVARALGDRGATYLSLYDSDELHSAYLTAHDGAFEADPAIGRQLYERADSVLLLGGTRNGSELADVPDGRQTAYARARRETREERLGTDWVKTIHPTRAMAQQAGMSYRAYRSFVYDSVLRDWAALAEEMAQLQELLERGSHVRLRKEGTGAGEPRTDLTMSVENRTAVNSTASVADDSHNLPSGEVYTAPVTESVAGTVHFDVPMTIRGRPVRDVRLTFEDGVVVESSAAQGEAVIEEVLETDDGARRLGELGVGMNPGIDRPTGQILFDEKMAGTVHLALGRAYDVCLPDGVAGNESAVHTDLITDMRSPGTKLLVDGEVVQQDGIFRWEADFED